MLERMLFSSFNHHSMVRMKQIDKSLRCGLLYECTMVRPWDYAVSLGMDALHPHYSEVLVPGGECEAAHAAGLEVNPWTVNAEDDLRRVIAAGADQLSGPCAALPGPGWGKAGRIKAGAFRLLS